MSSPTRRRRDETPHDELLRRGRYHSLEGSSRRHPAAAVVAPRGSYPEVCLPPLYCMSKSGDGLRCGRDGREEDERNGDEERRSGCMAREPNERERARVASVVRRRGVVSQPDSGEERCVVIDDAQQEKIPAPVKCARNLRVARSINNKVTRSQRRSRRVAAIDNEGDSAKISGAHSSAVRREREVAADPSKHRPSRPKK